jgi:uncharacterized protein YdhG (YjbR/CyaY superfamily)
MAAADVDEYLSAFAGEHRATLDRLRALIVATVPTATESISYQIPTYKLDGKRMLYFAGWSKHFSLYPLGERIPVVLAEQLADYETAKGTVQIPWTREFPERLILQIIRMRAEDAAVGR